MNYYSFIIQHYEKQPPIIIIQPLIQDSNSVDHQEIEMSDYEEDDCFDNSTMCEVFDNIAVLIITLISIYIIFYCLFSICMGLSGELNDHSYNEFLLKLFGIK